MRSRSCGFRQPGAAALAGTAAFEERVVEVRATAEATRRFENGPRCRRSRSGSRNDRANRNRKGGIVGTHAGDLISEVWLAVEMGCHAAVVKPTRLVPLAASGGARLDSANPSNARAAGARPNRPIASRLPHPASDHAWGIQRCAACPPQKIAEICEIRSPTCAPCASDADCAVRAPDSAESWPAIVAGAPPEPHNLGTPIS